MRGIYFYLTEQLLELHRSHFSTFVQIDISECRLQLVKATSQEEPNVSCPTHYNFRLTFVAEGRNHTNWLYTEQPLASQDLFISDPSPTDQATLLNPGSLPFSTS